MSKLNTLKILRYPLEILLLLLVIMSLFYFRLIIFHKNVTEPVDFAFSMIEDKFDITIPVFKPHIKEYKFVDPVTTSPEIVSKSTRIELDNDAENDVSIDKVILDESSNNEVVLEVPSAVKKVEEIAFVEVEDTVDELSVTNDATNKSDSIIMPSVSSQEISKINNSLEELINKVQMLAADSQEYKKINLKIERLLTEFDGVKRESQQNKVKEVIEIAHESDKATDLGEIRKLARVSYWKGEVDKSEAYYLDLLKSEQSDPDLFGELGNVYYAQGKWKQAGEAYYQAALRLHDLNQINQVNYLLRIIQGLDKESADKLRLKMSS